MDVNMSESLAVQRAGQRSRKELHLADRCDHPGCADRAVVVTRHAGLPLGHCRGHFEVHAEPLSALVVVDVRRIPLDLLDLPEAVTVPERSELEPGHTLEAGFAQGAPESEPSPAGRNGALLQRARLRLARIVVGASASEATLRP